MAAGCRKVPEPKQLAYLTGLLKLMDDLRRRVFIELSRCFAFNCSSNTTCCCVLKPRRVVEASNDMPAVMGSRCMMNDGLMKVMHQ
jgi:hypothetical protein